MAAVERPTLRLQLAVLGFSGLATLTRLQLAVLPLCYLAAVIAVGLRDRRLRATLREHRLAAGAIVLGVALGLGAALAGTVGIYGDVTAYRVAPLAAVEGFGATAFVLGYAVGWVIVPGALLGLALALARPRSRGELAFGVFLVAELLLLLAQAAVVGDAGRVQERYAMYVLPLVVVSFVLYASRGWPHLRAHALLAAVAATAAAALPLSGYAAGGGTSQSVLLSALDELGRRFGDVGLASLAFAVAATALSAVVVGVAHWRPSLRTPVAVGVTALGVLAVTGGAFLAQDGSRESLRTTFLPADASWVDATDAGPVTLLVAPRSTRADLLSTLFWNRSVRRLALLDGADKPDAFAVLEPAVDGAGRLDLPAGPLLTDVHGSTVLLRDADRVAAGPTKTLWRTGSAAAAAARARRPVLQRPARVRRWHPRLAGRARRPAFGLARARARRGRHHSRAPRGRASERAHVRGDGAAPQAQARPDPRLRPRRLDRRLHERQRRHRPRHPRRPALVRAAARRGRVRVRLGRPKRLVFL